MIKEITLEDYIKLGGDLNKVDWNKSYCDYSDKNRGAKVVSFIDRGDKGASGIPLYYFTFDNGRTNRYAISWIVLKVKFQLDGNYLSLSPNNLNTTKNDLSTSKILPLMGSNEDDLLISDSVIEEAATNYREQLDAEHGDDLRQTDWDDEEKAFVAGVNWLKSYNSKKQKNIDCATENQPDELQPVLFIWEEGVPFLTIHKMLKELEGRFVINKEEINNPFKIFSVGEVQGFEKSFWGLGDPNKPPTQMMWGFDVVFGFEYEDGTIIRISYKFSIPIENGLEDDSRKYWMFDPNHPFVHYK